MHVFINKLPASFEIASGFFLGFARETRPRAASYRLIGLIYSVVPVVQYTQISCKIDC